MNTNRHTATIETSSRKLAIAGGVCYLITHVTSVGAAILYTPILYNARYIVGAGSDTQVILGAMLELICALGIVGTSVALFPVVKKWNEGIALGYVGLRTLEAGIIAVGIVPLLAAVTLRQHLIGTADPATLVSALRPRLVQLRFMSGVNSYRIYLSTSYLAAKANLLLDAITSPATEYSVSLRLLGFTQVLVVRSILCVAKQVFRKMHKR